MEQSKLLELLGQLRNGIRADAKRRPRLFRHHHPDLLEALNEFEKLINQPKEAKKNDRKYHKDNE